MVNKLIFKKKTHPTNIIFYKTNNSLINNQPDQYDNNNKYYNNPANNKNIYVKEKIDLNKMQPILQVAPNYFGGLKINHIKIIKYSKRFI